MTQRRAALVVALLMSALGAPAELAGQSTRLSGPAPDTPRLLVAVFSSADNLTGFQVANSIRTRITNSVQPRQLWVTPWEHIEKFLNGSGFRPDSALGPTELRELARQMRADEVIMGGVTKTSAGLRIEARLARATDVTQGQPLPVVEISKPDDAARMIERSYADARKQLPDVKLCENSIRDSQLPRAISHARAGIVKYPNATIARLCLAQAFYNSKQYDSTIAVLDEIKKLDPRNAFAYRLGYLAYNEKGDKEAAVRALVELSKLDPSQSLSAQIVQALATLGKPAVALPIVDTMLIQSPGDPTLLRQKWLLLLASAAAADSGAARNALLGQAIQAGETMARSDSAQADSTYFTRQSAAAAASGNMQKRVEYASLATQKWPNNADLWYQRADIERRAGQVQLALQSINRVMALNPRYPNANVFVATIYVETNQIDSAIAITRRAVAAGEDKKVWGQFLLAPTNALLKKANETRRIEDFRTVLALAQEADRLAPSTTSKFFVGFSAYYIASDLLQQIQPLVDAAQKTKNSRTQASNFAKACPLARDAGEMKLHIMTNMPAGGSFQPQTAQQVLAWVGTAGDYIDQVTTAACSPARRPSG
ncbi:MAG: tetratricopeptide repeat protein [Gemmatimonadaceae bacterium]